MESDWNDLDVRMVLSRSGLLIGRIGQFEVLLSGYFHMNLKHQIDGYF